MVGTAVGVGFLQGEINYCGGGMPSGGETTATSGSITYTKSEMNGVQEAMIMATYGSDMISGTFSAQWCDMGSEW
jgi:hypothetical protein